MSTNAARSVATMTDAAGSLSPERYLAELAARPKTAPRQAPRTGLAALLARVDHPEQQLRCVHIAGSKGKGTTALMLEAMLQAGGRRTGVFTSPHLEHWNERIRINGRNVGREPLAGILSELQPDVADLHARGCNGPDFFEVLLVAALCLFRRTGVNEAIIEAGIGARFDATMVVRPVVTAVVSVELEHTDLLGNDLSAIARDKAAVARPNVPQVIGTLAPSAHAMIAERAAAAGAPLLQPRPRLIPARQRVAVDGRFELPLPAPGRAQAECAAVAFGCLRALDLFDAPETVAARALATLVLPGRQEVLARQPLVVADSAHTAASFAALAEMLAVSAPPPTPLYLVLSCSGSRDLPAIARPILERARGLFLTRADATRSADPVALADGLRTVVSEGDVRLVEPPCAALAEAREHARSAGVVCATGSVYMAGAARRCLHPDGGD